MKLPDTTVKQLLADKMYYSETDTVPVYALELIRLLTEVEAMQRENRILKEKLEVSRTLLEARKDRPAVKLYNAYGDLDVLC